MNAQDLRCENDLSLFNTLLQDRDVIRVNEMIAKHEAEGSMGTRRHLLATSVRLSRNMAPDIHAMADECIERLGVQLPLELYVYSSPQFNAACFKPEENRLFVMFSSSLLEGFTPQELRFVMGHELGHHIYNHHAVPIGYLLKNSNTQYRPDPKLVLQLFAWSRYAEISADRAGAHCAQDMDAVAQALFKLSSGLTSSFVKFSLDDFVAQVDDMQAVDAEPGQGAPQSDWFSTHPFSPIRVKALKFFEQSKLYSNKKQSFSKADLELKVQGVLSLMEPSYLEAKTDIAESMRRLLFSGLIAVADADGQVSEEEISLFEKFFGDYSFSDQLNIEKIKQALSNRAQEVFDRASLTQCMQVMHDLCLMAQADHAITPPELLVLKNIAAQLNLPEVFVDQVLDAEVKLD